MESTFLLASSQELTLGPGGGKSRGCRCVPPSRSGADAFLGVCWAGIGAWPGLLPVLKPSPQNTTDQTGTHGAVGDIWKRHCTDSLHTQNCPGENGPSFQTQGGPFQKVTVPGVTEAVVRNDMKFISYALCSWPPSPPNLKTPFSVNLGFKRQSINVEITNYSDVKESAVTGSRAEQSGAETSLRRVS